MLRAMGNFRIQGKMMRYSVFVPRLFNYCLSLGFTPGEIMPSRAFCSDENQGFPIILLTKHFGTFPFNHGQVGGIVATDRHGPHAHHGKDIVIIQASHVGYDPDSETFGVYRRLQTEHHEMSSTCGKVCGVTDWYHREYRFAQENILLLGDADNPMIQIDNQLLDTNRKEGLFLDLDRILQRPEGDRTEPQRVFSTSKAYRVTPGFQAAIPREIWQQQGSRPIGRWLTPDLFSFRREIPDQVEGQDHLERNLVQAMPAIVTSATPALDAARFNSMIEFDRTYRTLVRSKAYLGKNLLFVSGLNIDVSPEVGQMFPLTKFVPWAAYVQTEDGTHYTLEQDELVDILKSQATDNPYQIALDEAIHQMEKREEVRIAIEQ